MPVDNVLKLYSKPFNLNFYIMDFGMIQKIKLENFFFDEIKKCSKKIYTKFDILYTKWSKVNIGCWMWYWREYSIFN